MLPLQEAFNKVWERAKDKTQAMNGEACSYRAPDGKQCFVGCLIPDELYDPIMEDKRVRWICERFPKLEELFGCFEGNNFDFYFELQQIHDSEDGPKCWEDKLLRLATDFGLEVPKE